MMSPFHIVEPEVAGGLGPRTEMTRIAGQPARVDRLHYLLEGWLGDALIESTPCYMATAALAASIRDAGLSGVAFDAVDVSKAPAFDALYPGRVLPAFIWLKIGGTPGRDDFGMTDDLDLMVSDRALSVLKSAGVDHAIIRPAASRCIGLP